jgi:hypothetical protein
MRYQFDARHGPAMRAAITRIGWAMRRTVCPHEYDRLAQASDRLIDALGGRCCADADQDQPCRCDRYHD